VHTFADYLFLAGLIGPPMALAAGFLYLISPRKMAKYEHRVTAIAKAH